MPSGSGVIEYKGKRGTGVADQVPGRGRSVQVMETVGAERDGCHAEAGWL